MYVPNNVCIHSCRTTRLLFFSKEQKIVRQKSRTQAMHFPVVWNDELMPSHFVGPSKSTSSVSQALNKTTEPFFQGRLI